jgi:hypothetical protein
MLNIFNKIADAMSTLAARITDTFVWGITFGWFSSLKRRYQVAIVLAILAVGYFVL